MQQRNDQVLQNLPKKKTRCSNTFLLLFWEENNCTERQDNRMEQHVNLVRWLTYSSKRMNQNYKKKSSKRK